VKYALIREKQVAFPVATMCRTLGVSTSGFYAWLKSTESARTKQDAALAVRIRAAHQKSPRTYGSPRIHAELCATGVRVGRKRVARITRVSGLVVRTKNRWRRTTDSNHDDPIAPNIVQRDFRTEAADRIWVTGVTCIWTAQEWSVPRCDARPVRAPRGGLGHECQQRSRAGSRLFVGP